ncbi:MAG TPA: outer membrane protein assembly factor BamB [Gammaproteobacteria bacterium]|nr:outer membrane protein assembly factor BamB [Gammaproteobacteria bacterium]
MKGWMSMGGAVVVAAAAALSAIPAAAQDAATVARVSVSRSWALPLFQQWSIRPYAAARMAAGDGRAYVATREGRLFAVDAASGGVDWVRDLGGRISGGPAVGEQGRIYAGTDQGKVYALAADNGDTAWEGQVSSEVITAPRVGAGMVFVRTADDFLWALRAADGGSRWSFNVEGRSLALRGGSRPALDDGRVFVGFSSGELVALNAGDGAPRWREAVATPSGRTELERMVDVDAAPRVVDGTVIAAAYHGAVVALDVADGQQLWKRNFSVYNDPAVAGDRVFITTADQAVIALDRSNGGTLWTQKELADSGALSAPVVTEEAVVVGDGDGRITWFHRDSGKLIGQIDLGPSPVHGPPLALEGGVVLALTDQGTLHRLVRP